MVQQAPLPRLLAGDVVEVGDWNALVDRINAIGSTTTTTTNVVVELGDSILTRIWILS